MKRLVLFLIVAALCCSGCDRNNLKIGAKAAFFPSSISEIEWMMLPGGGQESLFGSKSLCVNLQITGNAKLTDEGMLAFFEADNDNLLMVFITAEEGEMFRQGEQTEISIDLDGYGVYLSKLVTGRKKPIRLYLAIGNKIYYGDLPEVEVIANQQDKEIAIDLKEGKVLPNQKTMRPVKAEEWPRLESLGAPALSRKQDGLRAIYFFYVKK